ncbi:MAG: sulfotransferase domain-containing protein [Chloroflexi bacterium]|nr:sulfotransferase domain-containing protein [Chloroflexota bacterium]
MDLKTALKQLRHRARRAAAARRWGAAALAAAPAVLGNAMPKSGSHLISQVLQGLPGVGPFVDPGYPPVNRDQANAKLDDAAVLANLRGMRPGDLRYGYVQAREPFLSPLAKDGRATAFVYRDPRDVIVSHVFYAADLHPGHALHRYYNQTLTTMEQRIDAAIDGVDEPGAELSPIRAKYENYLAWLDQPWALCLRFEDLILAQEAAFNRLLDYLEARGFKPTLPRPQVVAVLTHAIEPKRSGTFRKGQPGGWREHFTAVNLAHLRRATGDLLERLGYPDG